MTGISQRKLCIELNQIIFLETKHFTNFKCWVRKCYRMNVVDLSVNLRKLLIRHERVPIATTKPMAHGESISL